MRNGSHKISKGQKIITSLAASIFAIISLFGCEDWPDEKVALLQAQGILRDLSKIQTVPDPNVSVPDVYKAPPRKVKHTISGKEEWKLFYFCKYHTSDQLRQIIHEQFATKLFDEEGKSTTHPDYTVTSNPATNQLIVRCPSEKDIDAVFETLQQVDVPPIQVRIDCLISELYADLTMDRETSIMIEELFGENIYLGGKEIIENGERILLPAFPGAALRDPAREKFGLKIGYSKGVEGDRFKALIDILVSRGYLKILMNPTLEVINGRSAKIQTQEHVPLQKIYLISRERADWYETKIEYVDVIDSLEITPHVFADGYIGLETKAQIAAKLTPEGIKQLPIVTKREITNEDNRIRHGESLIIGGIRKTEKRDVIRGVPGLKDIPGLGLLFSSRDFEERAKEIIFIITPTISTGGKPNEQMIEELRTKHKSPSTKALHKAVINTLGLGETKTEETEVSDTQETKKEN